MLPWKYPGFLTRILLPEAVFRADPEDNRIYLTYDDGPDPEVTPELLDILAQRDARAVFFVVADNGDWWRDMIAEIASKGHRIALHGLQHKSKYLKSNAALYKELLELASKITGSGGVPASAYRPPFGHIRPDTVYFLKRKGIQTVLWSIIPGDFRRMKTGELYRRAMRSLRPGDILALHDGTRLRPAPTLELTKRLLDEFQRLNWRCECLDLPELNLVDHG